MDIQVGEYVRTKKRGIFKVLSIRETPYGHLAGITDTDRTFTIGKGGNNEIKNDIVSHSKDIIDLIQEGDYVNGYLVEQIDKDGFIVIHNGGYTFRSPNWIKTIITKEQIKQIEYRIEE